MRKGKNNFLKKFVESRKNNNSGGGSGYASDERFYTPKAVKDDNGNNKYTKKIRFLPYVYEDKEDGSESIYYILEERTHFVRNPKIKRVFMSPCPKSFGYVKEKCPLCEMYNETYRESNGVENVDEKEIIQKKAKNFRPDKKYISNILVLDDKENPENNGKVFLYKFGYHVYKAIMDAVDDEVEKMDDEVDGDVFDKYEGFDFYLNMEIDGKYASYKKSRFINDPKPIADSEEEIKEILGKMHSLKTLKDEILTKHNTYEEIEEKYEEFLTESSKAIRVKRNAKKLVEDDEDDGDEDEPTPPKKSSKKKSIKVEEVDEDDFGDDEFGDDEDEPTPPKKSSKKKTEMDDDIDDLLDDDDLFE